ncbi:MAG TPA: transcriptional regulator [Janthinobacterium sp.]|nr:transcriptional regulator [Janthinobacterium sp.]
MLDTLGSRQKELLQLLLKDKAGLTVDELSARLAVTRNAVRQHLAALENDGLLEKGQTRPSGGRPEQLYMLSDKGRECFPRHYSWFAQLLLESVQQESGAAGLGDRLEAMGAKVGAQLRAQHPQLASAEEKVAKLAQIMEELGYSARSVDAAGAQPLIVADNCVFHHLAVGNPEVCRFDLALMSAFTGSAIEHQECMARNGQACRFKFTQGGAKTERPSAAMMMDPMSPSGAVP